MSIVRNVIFWLSFVVIAILVQAMAPGLDVLVTGLIILLQEKDWRSMLWLLPLFVLLQEGMGTRPFGSVLIWYAATFVMFRLGRWLFETSNFIFIFLLSACLGGVYYGVAWLMAPLQDIAFNVEDTLNKALAQAIFLPFAWKMLVSAKSAAIPPAPE